MAVGQSAIYGCAANFLRGRKCVFCGSFKVSRTARGYIKCRRCQQQKSLKRLRREIAIIQGFYLRVPGHRLASDMAVDVKVIGRVYQRLRTIIFQAAELEGAANKMSGEIELDGACCADRRQGRVERATAGKGFVLGLLEDDGHAYTKVVENVSAATLMEHIKTGTHGGSVYFTDSFKGYQSLRRFGKHLTVSRSKSHVDQQAKNHLNGIDGFWPFAKHVLHDYRRVSKHRFPIYLKEIEFRFNHRKENLFKLFLRLYFGYETPQL